MPPSAIECDDGVMSQPTTTVEGSSDRPRAELRREIWDSIARQWIQGDIEGAIFDAFKLVESTLQRRLGTTLIGDALVTRAFGKGGPPSVDLSTDQLDLQRLTQLFEGSLGLFKGSRSHGAAPAIPADDDPAFALRLLAWASALLDLLDHDYNRAPAIIGRPQPQDNLLTVWVERTGPWTRVLIDGEEARVVSTQPRSLQVALDGISAGIHQVVLRGESHTSRPQPFEILPAPALGHWHRVIANDLPIFSDPDGTKRRVERAILLESLEGGPLFQRAFPSATSARPGEYVTWDWRSSEVVAESWIKFGDNIHYAWTAASFFSGAGTPPTRKPQYIALSIRPRTLQLRPGFVVPLRVIAQKTDGVGNQDEDVTAKMHFKSSNESIAFIDSGGVVRAKMAGTCVIVVDGLELHTEAAVTVASLPRGTVVEQIGGLGHPRGVAIRGNDLLVVDNSDTVWASGDGQRLRPLSKVALPYLAASGLDQILVSAGGRVAVRDMSARRFLLLDGSDLSSSLSLSLPDRNVTPMAAAWWGEALLVADHTGAVCQFGDNITGIQNDTVPRHLWSVQATPVSAGVRGDELLLLSGGGTHRLDVIGITSGKIAKELLGSTGPQSASAIAVDGERLWSCDFNTGTLHVLAKREWKVVATGLHNPNGLAVGADGSIFIAELGADSIARMLP